MKYNGVKVFIVSLITWLAATALCIPFIRVTKFKDSEYARTTVIDWSNMNYDSCRDMCMKKNLTSTVENDYHHTEVTTCDYYYRNETTGWVKKSKFGN